MNLKERFDVLLSVPYIQLEEQDASYYVSDIYNGGTVDIFFEWSNGKRDWINNFDFPAKPYRNGKRDWINNFDFPAKPYRDMKNLWFCHRGFLRVWKVIEPHVADIIMNPEIKNINIAGYSHGAAIAQLCYEYVRFNRPDIRLTGVGYGAPRIIWGFPKKAVRERFSGFVVVRNGNDIVTHLPPAIFGFRHLKEMVRINIGPSVRPIRDHYPEQYRENLVVFNWLENNENTIITRKAIEASYNLERFIFGGDDHGDDNDDTE